VFFDPARVRDFEYRRKRAGHLVSKMRFVSAQLEGYLAHDLWLANARRANALAQRLAQGLSHVPQIQIIEPVEANEVFAEMLDALVQQLRSAGAQFYDWSPSHDGCTLIRLVASCLTVEADVNRFLALLQKLKAPFTAGSTS
jgi:threonine aldolase